MADAVERAFHSAREALGQRVAAEAPSPKRRLRAITIRPRTEREQFTSKERDVSRRQTRRKINLPVRTKADTET